MEMLDSDTEEESERNSSSNTVIYLQTGEGNKPLFEQNDFRVNSSKTHQKCYKKDSSSSSSSSERYSQFDLRYIQRKNITSIVSSPEKSSIKKPSVKIPYFANEKREEERLERRRFRSKQQQHSRSEKRVSGHRRSSSSYRKSRSRTRSNSRHRSYQDTRHRKSLTRLHRQSRSRTRSRSRETTSYIPPIYPAAPSTSDYVYNPQNSLQQVFPIAPVPPPLYPFFIRPYGNPFPHLPTIPPFRYPMPTISSRHMYRATNHRQRNTRGSQLNINFHISRNP